MSTQRYLVTARKYRPQTFQELVAQEHVAETLKNAIRLDRLAHAYLFSGPRGVGKTTAARILAKAINCTAPAEARGDGAEPCRTCESCRSFEEGRSLNIIEIDAASNNKVEDVRDLRETVRIPPQGSRKKVYIIDEVHMLSNAAFNALLKTLEEPPPHVLFIFATTEPHKVLATILSRCQRFDFRRIPVPEIVARLRTICADEGVTADEASLMLIARKGDGALRDALSAFDQAVSLCGNNLVYADLAQALGVVDVDLFFEVTQHAADRNAAGMLQLVERIVRSGYDLQEFLVGLAEHLRNLLVARTMGDTALIEAAEATRQRYADTSRLFAEPDLLRLLMLADEAEEAIKSSVQPRLKLEMALLKMATLQAAADLRQVLQQLDRLEALARAGKLHLPANGAEPPASTPAASRPHSEAHEPVAPTPTISRLARLETPARPEDVAAPGAMRRERPAETPAAQQPSPPPAESREERSEPASPVEKRPPGPQPRPAPAPAPPLQSFPSLFGQPALKPKATRPPASEGEGPSNALLDASGDSGSSATMVAPAPIVTLSASPALRRVEAAWPRYVQAVKRDRIHVGSLLQHAAPVNLSDGTLSIAVPDEFHQRLLSSQHDFLLEHLQQVLDPAPTLLQFVLREAAPSDLPTAPAAEFDPHDYMQRKRQENPVIRAIFDQFGGELVW